VIAARRRDDAFNLRPFTFEPLDIDRVGSAKTVKKGIPELKSAGLITDTALGESTSGKKLYSRTASLRTKVSVAGKRNFAGRDNGAETASEDQGDHCRDMTPASNPADSALLAKSCEISV
jgi:hypothetical protein